MPELLDSQTRKASVLIHTLRLTNQEIVDLLQTSGLPNKFIGKGAECFVINMNGEPKKVAAFAYRELDPEKAKKIFLTHRIMSTLFPNNFPKFYSSFSTYEKGGVKYPGGSIREKLTGEQPLYREDRFVHPSNKKIKHDFERVLEIVRSL